MLRGITLCISDAPPPDTLGNDEFSFRANWNVENVGISHEKKTQANTPTRSLRFFVLFFRNIHLLKIINFTSLVTFRR